MDKPKYIKLFELIRDKINSNEYKANDKLPSKRDLAIDLNVSLNTVINAYSLLLDEGYIYSIEKKGYFVTELPILTYKNEDVRNIKEEKIEYKYDFTSQNVEYFIDTNWKRILKEELSNSSYINKSEPLGSLDLRLQIQKHLERNRGIYTSTANILIASGMEIMDEILRIIDIDNITLDRIGYHKLSGIAKNTNKKIMYMDLDEEGIKIPNKRTILYTTPFNQFPTGIKMSIGRKKEIISFLEKTDSILIEDDFDAEFRINSNPTTALYSLNSNKVIFFSTFSTTMYPGLRIAYLILPDNIMRKYKEMYSSYNNPCPLLIQRALAKFISEGYYASSLNKRKKLYIKKREECIRALEKYNIKYNSKANYLSLLINIEKNTSDTLLKSLKANGINIEALSSYDIKKEASPYLILGYTSININKIDEGIHLIKKIIGE